jgi:hypothetical protein
MKPRVETRARARTRTRTLLVTTAMLLAGCAGGGPFAERSAAPAAAATMSLGDCRAEVERLRAQLAAEVAERQRLQRAATRREDTLKKQIEAMKSIERGILEREDRMRTETR